MTRKKPPRPSAPTAPLDSPHARPWQLRTLGQCTWPIVTDGVTLSCCYPIERGSLCGDHAAIGYDTGVRKLDVDRAARHMSRFDRVEVSA